MRYLRLILIVLAAFVLGTLLVHIAFISIVGLRAVPEPAPVGFVLGNTVERDGKPSARLAGRLDRAIGLYEEGTVEKLVVSGALGKEGHVESEAMRAYLLERGIPEEAIIEDPDGINTCETARNGHDLMERSGWRSAVVVSDFYHVARARLAFRIMGVEDVTMASSPPVREARLPYAAARDAVGYAAYLLGKCR